MSLAIASRIARREMRSGIHGFKVFLACLAIGVAAIAAIGSVQQSINASLAREGASLLGGDFEIQLTYRYAQEEELDWLRGAGVSVSEIVDFRSMAVAGDGASAVRGLTQVKGVDAAYPLFGTVGLNPQMPIEMALAENGAVMDRILVERMGLKVGDTFRLGTKAFVLNAILTREPDSGGGFSLGPRTLVRTAALDGSGLLRPGTLFDSAYRVVTEAEADLDTLKREAATAIKNGGGRWRDRRNGAPGTQRFIERLATFLVLVGLAGLIVGGVGVSAAVRTYLDEKVPTIATLKSLGANGRLIFQIYAIQITVLTGLGIAIGLLIGAALPWAITPLLQSFLPVQPQSGFYVVPLLQAAAYGVVTAAVFALWPLARTERIRAAELFRDAALGLRGAPERKYIILTIALLLVLLAMAVGFSGQLRITIWAAAGLLGAYIILLITGQLMKIAARRLARARLLRPFTSLRHAIGAIGGPGSEVATVIVSLGLGLSVLASIGQIDSNLKSAIRDELPDVAPSFFFVDIQTDQLEAFQARLENDPAVSKIETAPMLRGVITRINGKPAIEAVGPHWVLSGDRGITYAASKPPNAEITQGQWWNKDYDGPPQISFAATEAAEMGLRLGDEMSVNVLGREITGTITSFRNVDFSNAGMGFILSMNPKAIASAPHSHIATVYADEEAEGAILRDIASAQPNVTVIGVRDAITRVTLVLDAVAGAITYGALASLVTGAIVLIGAAAAGERARRYEAAILKTLGATRTTILTNFGLRSVLIGLAAGLVATLAGSIAAWSVMTFVMDISYEFSPRSAAVVVGSGIALAALASAYFTLRSLSVQPARTLRARE